MTRIFWRCTVWTDTGCKPLPLPKRRAPDGPPPDTAVGAAPVRVVLLVWDGQNHSPVPITTAAVSAMTKTRDDTLPDWLEILIIATVTFTCLAIVSAEFSLPYSAALVLMPRKEFGSR